MQRRLGADDSLTREEKAHIMATFPLLEKAYAKRYKHHAFFPIFYVIAKLTNRRPDPFLPCDPKLQMFDERWKAIMDDHMDGPTTLPAPPQN